MKSSIRREIYRFVIVGIINTAIDIAVLNFLILLSHKGKSGFYYSLFKGISFLAAVLNSYFMNKRWTFAGRSNSLGKNRNSIQGTQFLLISTVGFFINDLFASFAANAQIANPGFQKFLPTIGALIGTACGLAWNYFGYKYIVFKKHKPDSELLPPA